jgi:hypothetical protein
MFDALAGCNETGIDRGAFAEILDGLLTLGNEASNTFSRRSIWPWVSSRCVVNAFFSSGS